LIERLAAARPGELVDVADVAWEDYERLLEWRDANRRGARLTYDSGRLEIMVVTNLHERLRKILAMLVEAWIEETGGEYLPSGQLTHKREDLEKGFEPDECYYIQNWKKVAGLRQIDFFKDPPPDLMIEVEVSRTVEGRLPVIAAFKIPEVWRYDGEAVTILMLQKNKKYKAAPASRAIPDFPFGDAPRFLEMAASVENSYATIAREFRQWIRSRLPRK
jgi:Uma2 family endonuclease